MQSRVPTQPCSLRIHLSTQRLDVVSADGSVLCSYPVSTSRFGVGTEPGSMKTPSGQFTIAEMIGHDAECGMIFRSRVAVGRIGTEDEPDDFVQTRILWLSGEETHNRNTHERYIYIHGTNQERQIGQPSSHGCVRMRNADVVELAALVKTGFPVVIFD